MLADGSESIKKKKKLKDSTLLMKKVTTGMLKVSKKQKLAWEKASCVGYMIEWDKDLRAFYRKDL